MDEVIPGLWIGDFPSALNIDQLKANNIYSILSAMRGRFTIHKTFIHHQIMLDDNTEEDVLVHFLPSITFIQAELDKGRGVLVHCQAGISRSATIVAAYLMYSQNLDCEAALELIRKSRSGIEPNDGFRLQLEIFHKAAFKISHRDKVTRMFYMERAVEEVMNGDGSLTETDMFAKFPRTPSDSAPATPGGEPRRRIRCKMCRQELATREHMLDHDQLGPPTPAPTTPAGSRRPSTTRSGFRPLVNQPRSRPSSLSDSHPRRPSLLSFSGHAESLSTSALETEDDPQDEAVEATPRSIPSRSTTRRRSSEGDRPSIHPSSSSRGLMDSLSTSALETEDDEVVETAPKLKPSPPSSRRGSSRSDRPAIDPFTHLPRALTDSLSALATEDDSEERKTASPHPEGPSQSGTTHKSGTIPSNTYIKTVIGRRPSDAVVSSPGEHNGASREPSPDEVSEPTQYACASDLAAQLYANPKLAALRSPMNMTPTGTNPVQPARKSIPISPPILANPKCSGYFVEPMKWMEPFLESGQLAGKIICPNKKCGAKLGNFDWAGVCCGCKAWVTPGFCINRSKVDEIV